MRRVLLAFLAVILLVALCAGISLRNYADQRNRVVVQDTVPNHLVKVYYREGLVTFREEKTLELPTGTVIEEIYLKAGEDFQVGDPLVKLEEESVLMLLYENQVAQENYNGYFYGAAEELADMGIAVRAGLHCAPLAHESAGTLDTGTVRISFGHDATVAQVGKMLEAAARLRGKT